MAVGVAGVAVAARVGGRIAAHERALRSTAREQAALRRVATLVAQGAESAEVLDAVCRETGVLIGATSANLAQFEAGGVNVTLAGWSRRDTHVPAGTRLPMVGESIDSLIQRTAAPARFDDYGDATGELATIIRNRGIRGEVGAPVIVDGRVWGALIVGTDGTSLPPGTEGRVASFAELVATALANAAARAELVASRARIVAAADEARRRIERDLHDGAQQQLVALALELRVLESAIPAELTETRATLDRLQEELSAALDDVREISRGLHPAILSHGGLGPALRSLGARSALPVELDLRVDERLPESIEIATYYVVSEALANAAKHADAAVAEVSVGVSEGWLRASIRDDGIGGAETGWGGSGLLGLRDRVNALGGRLVIDSPSGRGTAISVALPLEPRTAGSDVSR